MHSVRRALLRASGLTLARRSQQAARAAPVSAFTRFNSTISAEVPKNLLPTNEITNSTVSTIVGDLEYSKVPDHVRKDIWLLYVSTMEKLVTKDNNKPKKSALHWLIINAQTKEELDIAVDLTNQWRMAMMPITQATCQIWMEASARLDYPDVFMRILMDRWNYRQLPVSYILSKFIRHLGQKGEEHLDDAFRVFALYPFYGLEYDAQAYGALVEACCLVNTDEAWRRALIASEEGLSFKPKPLITLEALHALEKRSNEQGETEMASRYKSLASTLDLKPASKKSVEINADGDVIVKDHN